MTKYYEPNLAPTEVLEAKKIRTVNVRFETKQDALDFMKRTGILLKLGKTNKIKFPQTTLDQFFD